MGIMLVLWVCNVPVVLKIPPHQYIGASPWQHAMFLYHLDRSLHNSIKTHIVSLDGSEPEHYYSYGIITLSVNDFPTHPSPDVGGLMESMNQLGAKHT